MTVLTMRGIKFGEYDYGGHADDRQDEHEIEEALDGSTVCVTFMRMFSLSAIRNVGNSQVSL